MFVAAAERLSQCRVGGDGGELDVRSCSWSLPDEACKTHDQDAVVYCGSVPAASLLADGALRLIGPDGAPSLDGVGRLEVFRSGVWVSVCAAGFAHGGAQVACRTMGFTGAASSASPPTCRNFRGQDFCGLAPPALSELTCDCYFVRLRVLAGLPLSAVRVACNFASCTITGFRYACVANRTINVFLPRRLHISRPVHVMIGKCISLPVFGFLVISCRALRAADLHASFMLVSGTTAAQELCVTVGSGVLTVCSYCQIVFAACVCWKASLLRVVLHLSWNLASPPLLLATAANCGACGPAGNFSMRWARSALAWLRAMGRRLPAWSWKIVLRTWAAIVAAGKRYRTASFVMAVLVRTV